jgi:MFS family permease
MYKAPKWIELSFAVMRNYGVMNKRGSISQYTARNLFAHDFIFGFLGYFALLFACFAFLPTLPIYLTRLGSNEGEIGVLVGIFGVSALVSRLLAGGMLTKYSEKSVLIFAALLFAATFPVCIILRPFWPFFVVRLSQGVALACFDTAALALIIKVTPLTYRGRVLGYFMLAPGLATVMAPSFGMFLVNQSNFTIFFLFCMSMSLCALPLFGLLNGQEMGGTDSGAPVHKTFFFERKIIVPAMSAFFYNFVVGSIAAFFPLYAIQCGVANPGYFFSASAIMVIAGRALGGKIQDIWSRERTILTFTLTSMVAMVILSFSRTLPMFIFVGLMWGTGVAFIFPVSMAYALDFADSSGGAAVGTFRAFMDLGSAVGPMVMGAIVPLTGYRIMFLCLALVCLGNLGYFQFYVRKRGRAAPTG